MTPSDDEGDGRLRRGALAAYFGSAFPVMERYHERLCREGELRGLVGPREIGRLWERHILNSGAVVSYVPLEGTLADVGSGAGFPGIVIAAMRPGLAVTLIDPMERRCQWLTETAEDLGLDNVTVRRGRAEEFHAAFEYDVVTSRAVASLDKLARISLPLVRIGGEMVVLKGRRVVDELGPALKVLRRLGAAEPEIFEASTVEGVENTTVVRIVRQTGARRK